MDTYRTFKRAARNFEEFAKADKIEVETGLSIKEARERCYDYNSARSQDDLDSGTKLEFERE